jgi:hypothetical protein
MMARKFFVAGAMLFAAMLLGGCANFYVDGNTKEVQSSAFKKTDPYHPVQILFAFETKGVANERATAFVKPHILAQLKASGIFSEVSETPVAGNALLTITLNNVPLSDDAFTKGFVTGLTFGLAGSKVSDGYICTASYSGPGSSKAITKVARHAIHTTLGAASAPGDAVKTENVTEAVTLMSRQVVSNVLNDITHDAAFK